MLLYKSEAVASLDKSEAVASLDKSEAVASLDAERIGHGIGYRQEPTGEKLWGANWFL